MDVFISVSFYVKDKASFFNRRISAFKLPSLRSSNAEVVLHFLTRFKKTNKNSQGVGSSNLDTLRWTTNIIQM